MFSRGWLLVIVTILWSPSARAEYKCTGVPDSNPPVTQVWQQRCFPYYIRQADPVFSSTVGQQLLSQSFAKWSEPTCTDLEFYYAGFTSQGASFDETQAGSQKNVIMVVTDPNELPAIFDDPRLLAVTLTSFSTVSGEILDADIAFNAVNNRFDEVSNAAICATRPFPAYDYRNTLVHEIGHFIGFDHDQENVDSTMYRSAALCETKKRDLDPTDLTGLCNVYPKGLATNTCAPPQGGYGNDGTGAFREQCERAMGIGGGGGACSCRHSAPESSKNFAWAFILIACWGFAGRRR